MGHQGVVDKRDESTAVRDAVVARQVLHVAAADTLADEDIDQIRVAPDRAIGRENDIERPLDRLDLTGIEQDEIRIGNGQLLRERLISWSRRKRTNVDAVLDTRHTFKPEPGEARKKVFGDRDNPVGLAQLPEKSSFQVCPEDARKNGTRWIPADQYHTRNVMLGAEIGRIWPPQLADDEHIRARFDRELRHRR